MGQPAPSRKSTDAWPIADAGLAPRVVRCLRNAGIADLGALRRLNPDGRRALPRFGRSAERNVAAFLERLDRFETGRAATASLQSWLDEFLSPAERFVVTQRFGLDDPLYRPQMKPRKLREIGADADGGLTRERVRQLLRRALGKLRCRLARATASPLFDAARRRIETGGNVVTSAELASWRGAAWLGGCQPWGALLLLAETGDAVTRRHDYFSSLPAAELEKLESRLLGALAKAAEPLSPQQIARDVPSRIVAVMLDRHPGVDATREGRFFLFPGGATPLLAGLASLPPAEAVQRYDGQVAPHSRRTWSELRRVLG